MIVTFATGAKECMVFVAETNQEIIQLISLKQAWMEHNNLSIHFESNVLDKKTKFRLDMKTHA
jgi:hypothetical protein